MLTAHTPAHSDAHTHSCFSRTHNLSAVTAVAAAVATVAVATCTATAGAAASATSETSATCLAMSRVEGPRGHQPETPHPCQRAVRPGTRMQETDRVQMTRTCRGNA